MRNITPSNIMASHIGKTQSLTTHISPTDELPQLIQNIIEDAENRINLRLTESKQVHRYYDKVVSLEEILIK